MKLTKTQKIIILAAVALLLVAVAVVCIINGTQPGGVPVPTSSSGSESVATEPSTDSQGEVIPPVSGEDEGAAGEGSDPSDPSEDTDPTNPNNPTNPGKPTDPTKPTVKPTDPTKPTVKPTDPTKPTGPEGNLGVGIWEETSEPTDPTKPTIKPTGPTKPTDPTQPTTKPTDPTKPTTEPTDPTQPTVKPTDPTEPGKELLTFEAYEALSAKEKQAYMEETFDGDVKAFIKWYNEAKAEYEASTEPIPTYNGGDVIDIGKLNGKG